MVVADSSQLANYIGQFAGLVLGVLLVILAISLLIWFIMLVWRKGIMPEAERLFGDGSKRRY